jgi:hypothetical protein
MVLERFQQQFAFVQVLDTREELDREDAPVTQERGDGSFIGH